MSERPRLIATSSQTVGPFFHFGLTVNENLGLVAGPDTPGEHIQLRVRVQDGAGEPVPDAVVEIYQADAEGRYPKSTAPPSGSRGSGRGTRNSALVPAVAPGAEAGTPSPESPAPSPQPPGPSVFAGFGRLPTGADGSCQFKTIRPGCVQANGIAQAPHINVCLLARGLLRQVYTRIYFKDDPALATDPVLTLVPEDRRATLIADPSPAQPGAWDFVIRMQGNDETVFFDL